MATPIKAGSGKRCFVLNLQALGAFPDAGRPRVVWVGVTGPGLDVLTRLVLEEGNPGKKILHGLPCHPAHAPEVSTRPAPGRKAGSVSN